MFLLAAGLRFASLHDWQSTPFATVLLGDGREYDLWAQRIAAGDWWGPLPFYQAPLYPYFLASLRRLFDAGPEGVRVVQALIGAASCVWIARAGRSWFDARIGWVLNGAAVVILLAIVVLSSRAGSLSLQDRIAGTRLVPR